MTNTTIAPEATENTTTIALPTTFKVGKAGQLAAQKLQEASALEKRAKVLKAEANELLAPILPMEYGNKGTFGQNTIVKVARGTSTRTDLQTLAKAFPEAYAATVTQTEYVYYRI